VCAVFVLLQKKKKKQKKHVPTLTSTVLNVVICYVVQEFHKHQTLSTLQWLLHIVYNNQTHVVYHWYTHIHSGVGVRLKVGNKYWEDWRGGVWEGLCPPQLGVWVLAPRKKINFALKIMQFWASFGTSSSFLYYSRKRGDYPPVLKVGDLSPCPPPPAPTPMLIHWDYRPTCFRTINQHCQSIESKSPRSV